MHYVWETCWIRLEDVLTETVELNETSWKRLQDTFARRFEDVSKMSWRCLEDVFARPFEELLKSLEDVLTRRLEHVLKTYDQDKYIGLDQDVFWRPRHSSWLKTSSEDQDERRFQVVFIKKNVCFALTALSIVNHQMNWFFFKKYRHSSGLCNAKYSIYDGSYRWLQC